MERSGRVPSRSERDLFRDVMRDVEPRRERPTLPDEAAPPAHADPPDDRNAGAPPGPIPRSNLPELRSGRLPGLDTRSAMRLKRGQYPIEDRIDLHGMAQAEAHGALAEFVFEAAATDKRCVLVITGKGRGSSSVPGGLAGVLRRMVPRWLNQSPLRSMILGFQEAQPRHGGAGALYLLLRRRR